MSCFAACRLAASQSRPRSPRPRSGCAHPKRPTSPARCWPPTAAGWPDDLSRTEPSMTTSGTSTQPRSGEPARRPGLHRELRFFETTSISVGVMAPTLAMSVTGVAAAAALGRAAPLAFAVAALGVGLVAYGFVRLAGEFSHAGSVYGFVGNTLGPRPGFLAGWALLGTYLVFPPVSVMGVAVFGRAFLATTGVAANADWYPLALGGWRRAPYPAGNASPAPSSCSPPGWACQRSRLPRPPVFSRSPVLNRRAHWARSRSRRLAPFPVRSSRRWRSVRFSTSPASPRSR